MEGLNQVTLFGNIGQDPELKALPSGQSLLKFRLATTEVYFDKEGKKQERTDWHSIVMWGKRAEALSKLLAKGSRVLVLGRAATSSYEKEGQKHYRTEIVANELYFGSSFRDDASAASASRASASQPPVSAAGANGAMHRGAPAAFTTTEVPF